MSKVFRQISEANDWWFRVCYGKPIHLPKKADVIVLGHSLIDLNNVKTPFVGVHFIRDPRDVIVSGYLYHCRTQETWCINTEFKYRGPILFPKVPYSQQHRSEDWKAGYLESLNGLSYQENLLSMNQRDGLLFEMKYYGAWTIESMKNWNYDRDNIFEVKIEDLQNSFDETFRLIFDYLDFSESETKLGLSIAAEHDLSRKSDKEIDEMRHVSSKKPSKWKDYFEPEHKEAFLKQFGNVLVDLGYEKDNDW